jgi:hypothetical protein
MKKLPFHRRFEIFEESIRPDDCGGKAWQCTSKLGLIKAFIKGKPIRFNKSKKQRGYE